MNDDELRAKLRAADPAASLRPADPERLARLLEDTMSNETPSGTRESGLRERSPLTWVLAAAAVALILGVAVLALLRPWAADETPGPVVGDDAPTVEVTPSDDATAGAPTGPTVLRLPEAAAARCAPPSPDVLRTQDIALRGTVTSVDGGRVVLEPEDVYAGAVGATVEVAAPDHSLVALIGAPRFEVGTSYLLAASDGEVLVCGHSGPAAPALERLYARAFPR